MNEQIFRKKSLERVKSPESLDDYIKVANPTVWLLLGAVIVLLIGVCVWGIFGNIETTVDAVANVQSGVLTCTVYDTEIPDGAAVRVSGVEAPIRQNANGELTARVNIPDGSYEVEIVVESIQPMSFIMN